MSGNGRRFCSSSSSPACADLPASPFEAAAIDGAGAVRVFFSITLPMLRPVIIIAALLRMIDAARTYDTVFIC